MAIDANTKLLLHCNGADASTTFTDASPSAHGNATVNGNAQVDTAQSVFGGASLLCDGTGDYLSYSDHADWYLGSGDWTVDFRIRFNSVAGVIGIFMNRTDDSNHVGCFQNGNNIYFRIYSGGSVVLDSSTSVVSITTNTWYHVAIVRTGTTYKIFVDGVERYSGTDTDNWADYTGALYIGYYRSNLGTDYYHDGWIDEFRISNTARWTSGFTIPVYEYGSEPTATSASSGVSSGDPAIY